MPDQIHSTTKETFHYAKDHNLQTVTVTTNPSANDAGYWVIYIHGGAWRDPTETSSSIDPASSILLSANADANHIKAFASISYRLSPHPNFPQDPSMTPVAELRDARHPAHIRDVRAALSFLQRRFGFGGRYVLVGHSCGATMAFQAVMRSLVARGCEKGERGERGGEGEGEGGNVDNNDDDDYDGPVAILGIAGIYDIRLLRDTHRSVSAYQEINEGAFGSEESLWDRASPACVEGEDGVECGWSNGRLAVLARSEDDELVDASQQDAMRPVLARWKGDDDSGEPERRIINLPLKGAHDDSWKKGQELARAIAVTMKELQRMGLAAAS